MKQKYNIFFGVMLQWFNQGIYEMFCAKLVWWSGGKILLAQEMGLFKWLFLYHL